LLAEKQTGREAAWQRSSLAGAQLAAKLPDKVGSILTEKQPGREAA
jgi:hypothetical protein